MAASSTSSSSAPCACFTLAASRPPKCFAAAASDSEMQQCSGGEQSTQDEEWRRLSMARLATWLLLTLQQQPPPPPPPPPPPLLLLRRWGGERVSGGGGGGGGAMLWCPQRTEHLLRRCGGGLLRHLRLRDHKLAESAEHSRIERRRDRLQHGHCVLADALHRGAKPCTALSRGPSAQVRGRTCVKVCGSLALRRGQRHERNVAFSLLTAFWLSLVGLSLRTNFIAPVDADNGVWPKITMVLLWTFFYN